jgi:hypothetical protein
LGLKAGRPGPLVNGDRPGFCLIVMGPTRWTAALTTAGLLTFTIETRSRWR